jgi:hypothetical protein
MNVDNAMASCGRIDGNGARLIDRKPCFAGRLKRHFAFLHPKQVLAAVIDGSFKQGTGG